MISQAKKIQFQKLYAEEKSLSLKKLVLLKQVADPEKNKRLFELSQTIYFQILHTNIEDEDINLKILIDKVLKSLNQNDYEFFEAHKHKVFYQRRNLFKKYSSDKVQKDLIKTGYLGLRAVQKCRTYNQVVNCIATAKIQQYKDMLIKEYWVLKRREDLRNSLFQQEGFDQIKDLNQRELLLELKSNPELTNKAVLDKLNIPKTTAYTWIKDFREKGLL